MKASRFYSLFVGFVTAFSAANVEAQTTPGPQPNICTRSCWGARAPNCALVSISALTRAIVHHTAAASDWNTTSLDTSKSKVRGIQNYHMDTQGWCDIGYHFLVDKLGNIFEGRSGSMNTLRAGPHDACNNNSFGYTLMGYFHPPYNHSPTPEMLNAYYATIAWRMPSGWSPYGSGTYCNKTVGFLDGHRKVVATACPGDNVHPNLITENYNGGPMRDAIAARRTSGCTQTVTVDNHEPGFTASGNWSTGTSATDKLGTDYRFRPTAPISDPAKWTASLSCTGTYTVQAWWSQGGNRSATATYHIERDGGTSTVTVNQQANGGKWNTLGSFSMTSGTRSVQLSCWTTTGFVVIADGVRWVKN